MKSSIVIALVLLIGVVSAGCESPQNAPPASQLRNAEEAPAQSPSGETMTAILKVEGMTCPSCAMGVEYQLKQLEGVADAKVDYAKGIAEVTFYPDSLSAEDIAAASDVYPAKVVSVK